MKLLLDTHFVIWSIDDPGKFADAERALITAADAELIVSTISLWEVRTKIRALERRGIVPRMSGPAQVIEFFEKLGASIAALEPSLLTVLLDPPDRHADPFDEMLLVHAGQLGARLLTRDRNLRDHPLAYQP